MFDIGFLELMLISIIGLMVLGPERMPHAVKWLGQTFGKLRRTVIEISKEINTQLELEELKESLQEQKENLDVSNDIQKIETAVNEVARDLKQVAANQVATIQVATIQESNDSQGVDLALRKIANE